MNQSNYAQERAEAQEARENQEPIWTPLDDAIQRCCQED